MNRRIHLLDLRLCVAVLLLMGIVLAFPAVADDSLRATVSSSDVTIEGVTAGGEVILFGVGLSSDGFRQQMYHYAEVLRDDDRDGVVRYVARQAISYRTVLAVVDVAGGRVIVAGKPDYEPLRRTFHDELLRKNVDGVAEMFDLSGAQLDLLIVRPGAGAWRLEAKDGTAGDADEVHDGKLRARFSDALPLTSSSGNAPRHLKKGDVLVALNPMQMQIVAAVLEK
jgi:hypothetical protein